MSRKLLVAELRINEQPLHIATVHLESYKHSAPARKKQLKEIFPILGQIQHVMLMGDFNFCASWTGENSNLDPGYQDLWSLLNPNEPGYTEDTTINLMRLEYKGKHKQVRFDRMLLRSSNPGWQPQEIGLLGTEPVSADQPRIFPSDHFGLVGRFIWAAN